MAGPTRDGDAATWLPGSARLLTYALRVPTDDQYSSRGGANPSPREDQVYAGAPEDARAIPTSARSGRTPQKGQDGASPAGGSSREDSITVDTRRGRGPRRDDAITVDTRRQRPSGTPPRTPPRAPRTAGTGRPARPGPRAGATAVGSSVTAGGGSASPGGRFAKGIGLTALGTLIPGAGLTLTKRRRLGLLVLGLLVVVLAVLAIIAAVKGTIGTAATALTLTGAAFAALLVAIVVGTLIWVATIVLTAILARPRSVSTGLATAHKVFAGVMCLLVLISGIRVVQFVGLTHSTSDAVYTPRYTGRAEAFPPNLGRQNILLLGSDAGSDRTGVRTDSMMVMSSNTRTGATTLISIPRNLQGVPFPKSNPLHKLYPGGYRCPDQSCLMNAVWTEADTAHPTLFPKKEKNPGLDTTREVIEQIIGMRIDYTVVINLKGFEQLVNAMGGVYVTVPYKLAIGGSEEPDGHGGYQTTPGSIKGYLKPGYQKLNGYDALWYSRSRVQSSDSDRMVRQRCMVNALVNQANPIALLRDFPAIMGVVKANIITDVPHAQLGTIAGIVAKAKSSKIRTVSMVPPAISSYQPDFAKIRSLIHTAISAKAVAKKKPSSSTTAKKKKAATTKKKAPANTTTSC